VQKSQSCTKCARQIKTKAEKTGEKWLTANKKCKYCEATYCSNECKKEDKKFDKLRHTIEYQKLEYFSRLVTERDGKTLNSTHLAVFFLMHHMIDQIRVDDDKSRNFLDHISILTEGESTVDERRSKYTWNIIKDTVSPCKKIIFKNKKIFKNKIILKLN
jgi:hypothetical protein